MFHVVGAALITASLLFVLWVSRRLARPGAPRWLRLAGENSAAALIATVVIAVGFAFVLQGVMQQVSMISAVLGLIALAVPFVILSFAARFLWRLPEVEAPAPRPGTVRRGRARAIAEPKPQATHRRAA